MPKAVLPVEFARRQILECHVRSTLIVVPAPRLEGLSVISCSGLREDRNPFATQQAPHKYGVRLVHLPSQFSGRIAIAIQKRQVELKSAGEGRAALTPFVEHHGEDVDNTSLPENARKRPANPS